jgi:hypothetical protein
MIADRDERIALQARPGTGSRISMWPKNTVAGWRQSGGEQGI